MAQPLHKQKTIDMTAQLIVELFDVPPDQAAHLALKALNGIESHGGDSTDWDAISKTVRVVVASWLKDQ